MDENKLDELRKLVEFLKANAIAEFEVEREGLKLRLKFESEVAAPAGGLDMALLSQLMASKGGGGGNVPSASEPSAVHVAAAAASAAAVAAEEALHQVKSPIVGTFYESPSPGALQFVKIGDQVEVGQVLCIVEAMKLMNEIESDVAGEVVKQIAASGQPVEYGQPLFAIKAR